MNTLFLLMVRASGVFDPLLYLNKKVCPSITYELKSCRSAIFDQNEMNKGLKQEGDYLKWYKTTIESTITGTSTSMKASIVLTVWLVSIQPLQSIWDRNFETKQTQEQKNTQREVEISRKCLNGSKTFAIARGKWKYRRMMRWGKR